LSVDRGPNFAPRESVEYSMSLIAAQSPAGG
jgi:hypothetical protein